MTSIFDQIVNVRELELMSPSGSPLDVKLKIQGLHVATVKEKALKANAYVMAAANIKNDPDQLVKQLQKAEGAAAEMAAAAVVGWTNDEMMGGAYTPEYAKQVLAKPELDWVRKQINEYVANQSNFFRDVQAVAPAND